MHTLSLALTVAFLNSEFIHRRIWDDRRALIMHRTCRHRWSLHFYKNIGKARYAILQLI